MTRIVRGARFALILSALLVVVGCQVDADGELDHGGGLSTQVFREGSTNANVISDDTSRVLVDIGEKGVVEKLATRFERVDVDLPSIDLAVLTHAHHDHGGGAMELKTEGVPVYVHADDADMLRLGINRESEIIGPEAAALSILLDTKFPGTDPSVSFTDDFWLFDGRVEVRHVGGHTAGSVVVIVDETLLIAGDLVRGGYLGGMFSADEPLVHYFHENKDLSHATLLALMTEFPTLETIWPAHGGPFSREEFQTFLDELE